MAPAKAGEGLTLNPHQTELVHKVSGYFSEINTLQGNFVQTGADNKRMKGKFYVKRPGRFRFDYARPSRQIVVSDGHYLSIQDLDLNNEDRVALDDTPFRLLLRSGWRLVALESFEEDRALQILEKVGESLSQPVRTWSVARGVDGGGAGAGSLDAGIAHMEAHEGPALFALLDAHRVLGERRPAGFD